MVQANSFVIHAEQHTTKHQIRNALVLVPLVNILLKQMVIDNAWSVLLHAQHVLLMVMEIFNVQPAYKILCIMLLLVVPIMFVLKIVRMDTEMDLAASQHVLLLDA